MDGDKKTEAGCDFESPRNNETNFSEDNYLEKRMCEAMEKFSWLKNVNNDTIANENGNVTSPEETPLSKNDSELTKISKSSRRKNSFRRSVKSWRKRSIFRSMWQRIMKRRKQRDQNVPGFTIVKTDDIEELLGVCCEIVEYLSENHPGAKRNTILDTDLVTIWDHRKKEDKATFTNGNFELNDREATQIDVQLALDEGILNTVATVSEKQTDWVEVTFQKMQNVKTSRAYFEEKQSLSVEGPIIAEIVKVENAGVLDQMKGNSAKDQIQLQSTFNNEREGGEFDTGINRYCSIASETSEEKKNLIDQIPSQSTSSTEQEEVKIDDDVYRCFDMPNISPIILESQDESTDLESAYEISEDIENEGKSFNLSVDLSTKTDSSFVNVRGDLCSSKACSCECHKNQADLTENSSDVNSLNLSTNNDKVSLNSSVFILPKWFTDADSLLLADCPSLKLTSPVNEKGEIECKTYAESKSQTTDGKSADNCASKCSYEVRLMKRTCVAYFTNLFHDMVFGSYLRQLAEYFLGGFYKRLKRIW